MLLGAISACLNVNAALVLPHSLLQHAHPQHAHMPPMCCFYSKLQYAAEQQYGATAAAGWAQGAHAQQQQQVQQQATQAAEPKWRVRPRRAEEREVRACVCALSYLVCPYPLLLLCASLCTLQVKKPFVQACKRARSCGCGCGCVACAHLCASLARATAPEGIAECASPLCAAFGVQTLGASLPQCCISTLRTSFSISQASCGCSSPLCTAG